MSPIFHTANKIISLWNKLGLWDIDMSPLKQTRQTVVEKLSESHIPGAPSPFFRGSSRGTSKGDKILTNNSGKVGAHFSISPEKNFSLWARGGVRCCCVEL